MHISEYAHAAYGDMKREQVVQALSRLGFEKVPIELPVEVEPGRGGGQR